MAGTEPPSDTIYNKENILRDGIPKIHFQAISFQNKDAGKLKVAKKYFRRGLFSKWSGNEG